MAAAAPSSLAISVRETNGAKLNILLIDGGTTIVREIFDRLHPPSNLLANLQSNYDTLSDLLKTRVLLRRQWDLLFPPGEATPDSKTFDFHLLFLLLINICGLSPPPSGWHTSPAPSDTSLEANLVRVKYFHKFYGHVSTTGVDTPNFNFRWQEISAVLVALGLDQVEIDNLKAERWGKEDNHNVEHGQVDNVTSIDLATAAPSPLASSVEKINGAKLNILLIDGGTTIVREIFDRLHPPSNLLASLKSSSHTLNILLKRGVLLRRQWDLLFPPGGAAADSKTFDFHLLFILLTNICGLSPPPSGWNTTPAPSDTSLEANLVRVKYFRSTFYSHVSTTGVDTPTFTSLWQDISAVLVSLGLDQAEIDGLKAERWGEGDYRHVQHDLALLVGKQLGGFNNTQLKIQETVEKVRRTELHVDVHETLRDSYSKLDEVLEIPQEIRAQGSRAETAFNEASEKGSVPVCVGLGQDRAGKTSLKKFLLGTPFDSEEESTVGVEVEPTKLEVEIDEVKNWHCTDQKTLDLSEDREDVAQITAEHVKALEAKNQEAIDSMNLEQAVNDTSRLHEVIVFPEIEIFPHDGVAAVSQRVSEHQDCISPTTLKVTILGDELATSAGGLSTLNKELAIHLAEQPDVEVTFFIPEGDCTYEHKKTVESYGITVVEARRRPGYDRHDWLSFPPPDLSMDVVIGHGVKLGRQGQVLKCPPFDNRKWVQVVHTAQEQLGMFKKSSNAVSKAGSKHEAEVDLCKLADLVVPVGPKLAEAYSSCLRSKDTFVLTPGLFKEFADLKQDPNDSSEFKVLLCGRGESEVFEQKGYDIGAEAFADEELKGKPYRLLFVGAPDGREDEVAIELLKHGIAKEQLTVRKFVQSRDKMKELFCEVDLAIMPSRTEGFGLIALEALSASLPILVSSNSGFARALRNLQSNTLCIVDSKKPKDWAKAIKAVRERHGEELQEIQALKESYGEKYSWDKQCNDLVEKIRSMFHELT